MGDASEEVRQSVVIVDGPVTNKYVSVYYDNYKSFRYCTAYYCNEMALFGRGRSRAQGDKGREVAAQINPWLKKNAVRVEQRDSYYRFYLRDNRKYATSPIASATETKPSGRRRNGRQSAI